MICLKEVMEGRAPYSEDVGRRAKLAGGTDIETDRGKACGLLKQKPSSVTVSLCGAKAPSKPSGPRTPVVI